ncbi:MAG: COQ9 family protein [Pseudomonadota bacterium]
MEKQREDLARAAIEHVPFDGWTDETLKYAAQDLDIDPQVAMVLFPDPVGDLISAFIRLSDDEMKQRLPDDFETLRVREKVTLCVRTRLEIAGEHEEASRRAIRALAQPRYARLASEIAWQTADVIWLHCGDTATDYNYYTKRAILSGVYSSTLLYWLQDKSDDKSDTWAFLDRRIAGIMQFEKVKATVLKRTEFLPNPMRFFNRLQRRPV